MPSHQLFATSKDYLICLRSLGDLFKHHPDRRALDDFESLFPMTPKPDDFRLALTTLRNLLIEFPDTTEPDAVSAKRQARAVLKRYDEWLNPRPRIVPEKDKA